MSLKDIREQILYELKVAIVIHTAQNMGTYSKNDASNVWLM